jgi:hypothetical protein
MIGPPVHRSPYCSLRIYRLKSSRVEQTGFSSLNRHLTRMSERWFTPEADSICAGCNWSCSSWYAKASASLVASGPIPKSPAGLGLNRRIRSRLWPSCHPQPARSTLSLCVDVASARPVSAAMTSVPAVRPSLCDFAAAHVLPHQLSPGRLPAEGDLAWRALPQTSLN